MKIISFFMALYFSLLSFFGVPFEAKDLKAVSDGQQLEEITQEDIELFKKIYESETDWLASLQLENGAIPMTGAKNGELKVNPYFADVAALALLDRAELYEDNVRKYADWHFEHLNTAEEDKNGLDGTIYDYTVTVKDGQVIKEEVTLTDGKKTYDSTDSYAATFLSVLCKYYEKTGDITYIKDHKQDIYRIIDTMLSTLHDGLTYAKPDHTVKYLMDNCEVYTAALDMVRLIPDVFPGCEEGARRAVRCEKAAEDIAYNVNYKLWSFTEEHYLTEISKYGIPTKIYSWGRYYPCACSQVFPIISGIVDPSSPRAAGIYAEYCENYEWESFDIPDAFYWGSNVLAAAVMGDTQRVIAYMQNYEPLTAEHKYPLYNADIARVSMAAYTMLVKYNAI